MADKETARDKEIRLQRYRERKTIITLDLGAKTGIAIAKNGAYSSSEAIDFSGIKKKGAKYYQFSNNLIKVIDDSEPSFIAYEKVRRHKGVHAAHAYGAYEALILIAGFYCGVPVVTMEVGEIKKFITGKGNADKQMVINAVNERGHNITDDNEADAVAMMHLQLSLMEK